MAKEKCDGCGEWTTTSELKNQLCPSCLFHWEEEQRIEERLEDLKRSVWDSECGDALY